MSGFTIHIPIAPLMAYDIIRKFHEDICAYIFSRSIYAYENMCKDEYEGVHVYAVFI